MLCRFAYLLVRRFLDVLSSCFRSRLAKEAEIAVLRHQIEVLRRRVSRLDLEPADRAVLALLSREPALGLSAHRGRAPPPRHLCVRKHSPASAASGGTRKGNLRARLVITRLHFGPDMANLRVGDD